MKKLAIVFIAVILAGCQPSDEELRADVAGKAMEDLNFAGLQYTVQNGVLNVTGDCPSPKAFEKVKQTVESIKVLKGINYKVNITPVTLDTLTPLKLRIDSVLAQYPQVNVKVASTEIVLKGSIKSDKKQKLLSDLANLQRGVIKDSLTTY